MVDKMMDPDYEKKYGDEANQVGAMRRINLSG